MKIRITLLTLSVSALACSSSTDFCSQKVTISLPASGGCVLDGGVTVIVPTDTAACETAVKSCSSGDQQNLVNRVACGNDAGANAPTCVAGGEQNWYEQMDTALGTCIAQNEVTDACMGALADAGL